VSGAVLVLVALAAAAAFTVGTSASTKATIAGVPGTYSVLSFFPQKNYDGWLRGQIKQFEAKNPGVKIKVQYTDVNTITQKVKTAVASGTAPDLVTLFPGSATTQLWTAGKLLDFRPAINADKQWKAWTKGWSKVPVLNYSVDGHFYAAPISSAPSLVWYWKDDVASVGYKRFPKTMAGLVALSKALRAKGMQPLAFGYSSQSLYNGTYLFWTLEANYDPFGRRGRLADQGKYPWTSTVFKRTVQLALQLKRDGLFWDPIFEKSYDPDQKVDWGQKKAAMSWPFGPWMDGYYPDSKVPNVGVAMLPPVAGSKTTVPGSIDMEFGIPTVTTAQKDRAHQETMLAFVKQTASPSAQAALWQAGILPIYTQVTSTPNKNAWAPVLAAQIHAVEAAPATTDIYTYSPNTDAALSNGFQAVLSGNKSVAGFLADVQKANKKDHSCAPRCR
jgi:ABC-type glycerol-3-phosphate transport system substrate-binding protein